MHAALGRTFLEEEAQPANSRVVLISDGFWHRQFGGRRDVLGRVLTLNNRLYSVVGVLAPQFQFPSKEVEVWLPLTFDGTYFPRNLVTVRDVPYLGAIGRLKAGVSLSHAQAELNGVMHRLEQAYPESNKGIGITAAPLIDDIVGKARPALLALMGGVLFVLLITCTNIANLMLARSLTREREIAVRAAIGAARSRILRQLLTESTILAVLGGAFGLLIARWGTRLFVTFGPAGIPRLSEVGLDAAVLAFAIAISGLTAVLFGLAPARRLSRMDWVSSLQGSGPTFGGDSGQSGLRRALVVVEIALSLTLLAGAGLMIRSFSQLMRVDPGFDPKNLIAFQIMLPQEAYYGNGQRTLFFDQKLFDALHALPGAKYVGYTSRLPFAPNRVASNVAGQLTIEGQTTAAGEKPLIDFRLVNSEYFRAMGIPLLEGRKFSEHDTGGAPLVSMVNESAARLFFTSSPVGKRIKLEQDPNRTYTVIGVVASIRHMGLETTPRPEVYFHMLQSMPLARFVVIRTADKPASVMPGVREAVRKLDRRVPVFGMSTMEQLVTDSMQERRFSMFLMAAFAIVALTLTAVGIYGIIAYSVTQRTHEIGIRVALGACHRDVIGLVAGEIARIVLTGFGIGLVAALALSHLMSALFFGVQPTDPITYAAVGALQFAVALLAAYIPTRRAMRIDPMTALRHE